MSRLVQIGPDWSRLVQIGTNWSRLVWLVQIVLIGPDWPRLVPNQYSRVPKWSSRVSNLSSRLSNWSSSVPSWSSRVVNWSSRVSNWSSRAPNWSSMVLNWSSRVSNCSRSELNYLFSTQLIITQLYSSTWLLDNQLYLKPTQRKHKINATIKAWAPKPRKPTSCTWARARAHVYACARMRTHAHVYHNLSHLIQWLVIILPNWFVINLSNWSVLSNSRCYYPSIDGLVIIYTFARTWAVTESPRPWELDSIAVSLSTNRETAMLSTENEEFFWVPIAKLKKN